MNKLYAIGELLIDFQSVGTGSLKQTERFMKKAGGAPANVCAQAVRLGPDACYLTKVGDDGFGDFLIQALKDVGIETKYIQKDPNANTSLAFVSFQENGEREFSFYRTKTADLSFQSQDFAGVTFAKDDLLEFGSVALQSEENRAVHRELIAKAKQSGAIIAFDPNLRLNLWKDHEELRRVVKEFAGLADIMKIGKDEAEWVYEKKGEDLLSFLQKGPWKILLLTDGSKGATLYANAHSYHCPGYRVKAIDTTGAGDSFFGAFLGMLLREGLKKEGLLDFQGYQKLLNFACKAGAYTTTQYGAIQIMGNLETIERMVQ